MPFPARRTSPQRSAFTLIELLVVIGVIVVLLGILVPAVSSVRKKSRQFKCLNSIRQIGLANEVYMTDYPDWNIPYGWGWTQTTPPMPPVPVPNPPANGPRVGWGGLRPLEKFFNSRLIGSGLFPQSAICPDAFLAYTYSSSYNDVRGYNIGLSYGMNTSQLDTSWPAAGNPNSGNVGPPTYLAGWMRGKVLSPSEKIQFIDAVGSVSSGGKPPFTTRYFLPGWGEVYYVDPTGVNTESNIVAYRHDRGANALFFDGHAEWIAYTNARYDPTDPTTAKNLRQWSPKTR